VWLASDFNDHLGAFITAGVGPIPTAALDPAHILVEDIESRLCQLPLVSQTRLLVSVKRPDDFIDLAERGIFVYDWTDINRTVCEALCVYEPVAVPTKPVTVVSLPSDLKNLAKGLKLINVEFAAGAIVDIRAHFNCAEAD
jgi:hypothetical protein